MSPGLQVHSTLAMARHISNVGRRMRFIAAIFLTGSLSSLTVLAKDYGALNARTRDVSLVQLIVQPEKYSDTSVRVRGALHWHFEGSYLFLTREHLEAHDTASAI